MKSKAFRVLVIMILSGIITACNDVEAIRRYLPFELVEAPLIDISSGYFTCTVATFNVTPQQMKNREFNDGPIIDYIDSDTSRAHLLMYSADKDCGLPKPHRENMKSNFDFLEMNNISFKYNDGEDSILIYDKQLEILIVITSD